MTGKMPAMWSRYSPKGRKFFRILPFRLAYGGVVPK
jgi:hypothetical protein